METCYVCNRLEQIKTTNLPEIFFFFRSQLNSCVYRYIRLIISSWCSCTYVCSFEWNYLLKVDRKGKVEQITFNRLVV